MIIATELTTVIAKFFETQQSPYCWCKVEGNEVNIDGAFYINDLVEMIVKMKGNQ